MSQETEKWNRRRIRDIREIQRFFFHACLLLTLIYVLFTYVVGLVVVPNGDMHPRMDQGDLLVFYRLDEHLAEQEVVVFRKNETTYVGRIVACPEDTFEITSDEKICVNGNRILEADIYYSTPEYEGFVSYPLVLGNDEYFLLGDLREGAEDSRYFGPVNRNEIMGTVITVVRRNHL